MENRVFHCVTCEKVMYRVSETGGVLVNEDESMPQRPIQIVMLDRYWRFCSKACLLSWLEKQPEEELRMSGYAIW